MDYDSNKVDDVTLALMHLVLHGDQFETRAWKGFDWNTLDRLHEKGFISDPRSKAKSVIMTDKGLRRCEEMFQVHFGRPAPADM